MIVQSRAVELREVRHSLRIGDEFSVDPVAQLVGAKARPTPLRHRLVELVRQQCEKVQFVDLTRSEGHII